MKRIVLSILVVVCFLIFFSLNAISVVYAHDGEEFEVSPDAWMDNYTLVVTDAGNINEAYQAAETIRREGGHIGVIIPNQVMLGWVPKDKVEALVGKSKIRGIYHESVSTSRKALGKNLSESAVNAMELFNEVVAGEYKARKSQARAQMAGTQPVMLPDAFEAGSVSYKNVMKNLLANGLDEKDLAKDGIFLKEAADGTLAPSPGNSDYMIGKILFNAIFVESIGGVDPNQYTWTTADRATIQSEILAGLSWWSNTAGGNAYKVPLTYVYVPFYDSRTQTNYEPIRHSSGQDYLWINQIMGKFGFTAGDKMARTTAFNTARRRSLNTNWSVVSFIGYNPSPAPSTFTDGYFAYAYLRGPYSQLLFRNNGWLTAQYDIVNAHETGHLFGAVDEYYVAGYGGCSSCGVATNGVINGNCERCNTNRINCMMRGNSLALCGYTPGHLGWTGVQYLQVQTYRQDNGAFKDFFVPGERIQYKAYYCLAGPRLGTTNHTIRIRFRADYLGGVLGSSNTIYDDTGWGSSCCPNPPTSTGLSCYVTWWNRTVPLSARHGSATLTGQLEVTYIGKGAATDTAKFYVAEGADTTEPSPLLTSMPPFGPLDEELAIEPAPLPWEK